MSSALPIAPFVPLVSDHFPIYGFEGCCFALSWSESFHDATVHASDVTCLSGAGTKHVLKACAPDDDHVN